MSTRSITVKQGYYDVNKERHNRSVHMGEYSSQVVHTNDIIQMPLGVSKVLTPEIDIFSTLPESVYNNSHAKLFLDEMKNALANIDKAELETITLSKLVVTEHTELTLVLEWIFNYFRMYFSFDAEEGDYYGEVSSNPDRGEFHNAFNKMEMSDFSAIAKSEVVSAIKMAGGKI